MKKWKKTRNYMLMIAAFTAALPGLAFAESVASPEKYEREIDKARQAFGAGKLDEAYKIGKSLTAKDAAYGFGFLIMGTVQVEQGQFLNGEENLLKALSLSLAEKDKANAYHGLGVSAFKQGKYKAARELAEKSLKLNPDLEKTKALLVVIEEAEHEDRLSRYDI